MNWLKTYREIDSITYEGFRITSLSKGYRNYVKLNYMESVILGLLDIVYRKAHKLYGKKMVKYYERNC